MITLLKDLSDKALMDSLQNVVRDERHAVVMSLECLLEITSRDLPARLGYPSLFAFLTRHCKLSESCASKRGTALAAARRFPEVLALLRDGKLHPSPSVADAPANPVVETHAYLSPLRQPTNVT